MNTIRHLLFAALLLAAGGAEAQNRDAESKTVIGPRNPNLVDGAQELLAGNAEEGIRLTKLGLDVALGQRERQAGLGNICAGYVMLRRYETALDYCNQALDEYDRNWRALTNRALIYINTERYQEAHADLLRAESLAPNNRSVKEARGLYRDATDPVTPNIVIDDRRAGTRDDDT